MILICNEGSGLLHTIKFWKTGGKKWIFNSTIIIWYEGVSNATSIVKGIYDISKYFRR